MTTLDGPLEELVAEMIPKIAVKAHRRFPMVPAEDFEQEIWVRALKSSVKLAKHLRNNEREFIWTELRRAATKLGMEDDRYRRACKAKTAGYRTFDEEFYSTGVLGRIITALAGGECKPSLVMSQALSGTDSAGVHINADDPFSGAEEYMAALVDVQKGLSAIKPGQRRLLLQYYGLPVEDTEEGRWERRKLASSMGLTYEALKMRVQRALRALQCELGGASPWRKQDQDQAA